MKTWKLTIEYDGTKYSGWQEQRNARTVQGQLRKAAEEFLRGYELIFRARGAPTRGCTRGRRWRIFECAGRRKDDQRRWPKPDEILRAINSRLPSDVCLLDVAEARADLPRAA